MIARQAVFEGALDRCKGQAAVYSLVALGLSKQDFLALGKLQKLLLALTAESRIQIHAVLDFVLIVVVAGVIVLLALELDSLARATLPFDFAE